MSPVVRCPAGLPENQLAQSLGQLVGAAGVVTALNPAQFGDSLFGIHPLNQPADPFQVAFAAADKTDIFDDLAIHLNIDQSRTGAGCFIGRFHIQAFCDKEKLKQIEAASHTRAAGRCQYNI